MTKTSNKKNKKTRKEKKEEAGWIYDVCIFVFIKNSIWHRIQIKIQNILVYEGN